MNPGQASQAILIFILVSIWTGLILCGHARMSRSVSSASRSRFASP